MGTDRSRTTLRGIVRMEPALSWWEDESGEYNNAGTRIAGVQGASPISGIPVPDTTTRMALRASGTQSEQVFGSVGTLYVRTAIGGIPGTDQAGLLWSGTSQTADMRGCDLPNVLCSWDEVFTTANESALHPRAAKLSDDQIIVVYDHETGGTADGIHCKVRTTAGVWGAAVTVDSASQHCYPVVIVDGTRIKVYRWARVPSGAYQIRLHYSDDSGATWTTAGDVLDGTVTGPSGAGTGYDGFFRISVGQIAGQTLLVAHIQHENTAGSIWEDRLTQWASADGGMHFSEVGTWSGADEDHAGAYPEVIVRNGTFLVGWLHHDEGGTDHWHPAWTTITSAWTNLENCDYRINQVPANAYGVVAGGGGPDHYIDVFYGWCSWPDDDGSAYYTGTVAPTGGAANTEDNTTIWRTPDGETWYKTGNTGAIDYAGAALDAQVWNSSIVSDHDDSLRDMCGVAQRGRSVVVTSYNAAGTHSEYLVACYLGGWNTATLPLRDETREPTYRTAWDAAEISTHLPSATGYTFSTAAGGTEALTNREVVLTGPGAGAQAFYNITTAPTAATANGLRGEWCLKVSSGTASHHLITSDAALHYDVEARVTSTAITVWDNHAGAAIGGSTTITAGQWVRIRFTLQGSTVRLLWCYDSTSSDRDWDTAVTGTAQGVVAAAAVVFRFGLEITGAGGVKYREWKMAANTSVGSNATDAPARANLYPRSILPTPVFFGNRTSLSAVTGPTICGDSWTITPNDQYSYLNVDPRLVPSPRRPWRSRAYAPSGSVTTIRLSWSVGNVVEDGLSDLWAAYLDGMNFGGAQIYLYYGGAWNLAGTVGYDEFTTARDGKTLRLSGATSGAYTWRRGELNDCHIDWLTGNDASAIIEESVPGITRIGSGTSRTWACRLNTYDAGWSATPTVRVYPRRALLLMRLSALASQIRGIQIRIPVPTGVPQAQPRIPYGGYYEIGQFLAGPVWVWGAQYSWGRSLTAEPLQEILTAEDGTRTVRALGPLRRRVEIGWNEGVCMYDALTNAAPDYVRFAGAGSPVAFAKDAPMELIDQLRELQGAKTPVVYLPYLPRNTSGGFDRWAQGAIYGRIVDAVAVDSVVGDEESNEVARVQRVVIEEEL